MIEMKRVMLGDIITFKNGKKRLADEGDVPVYGGNGILGYTNSSNYSNCIIIGRVGAYCGSVYYEPNDCWISDNAISAVPKSDINIYYAFYLLKSLHLNYRHIGTSQPLLTQEILNKIECLIPELNIQVKISNIIRILDEKIKNNNSINRNLS
ncbi:MAG: restriction endonuclease subunit S, partial [Lachnospiraceae bacterium]